VAEITKQANMRGSKQHNKGAVAGLNPRYGTNGETLTSSQTRTISHSFSFFMILFYFSPLSLKEKQEKEKKEELTRREKRATETTQLVN